MEASMKSPEVRLHLPALSKWDHSDSDAYVMYFTPSKVAVIDDIGTDGYWSWAVYDTKLVDAPLRKDLDLKSSSAWKGREFVSSTAFMAPEIAYEDLKDVWGREHTGRDFLAAPYLDNSPYLLP